MKLIIIYKVIHMEVKITSIGNSTGIILTKEMLTLLRAQKGDKLYVTETPNGIELTAYNKELLSQMDMAEEIMRQNRNVLKKLAE
jgi:putative addiction module antidote